MGLRASSGRQEDALPRVKLNLPPKIASLIEVEQGCGERRCSLLSINDVPTVVAAAYLNMGRTDRNGIFLEGPLPEEQRANRVSLEDAVEQLYDIVVRPSQRALKRWNSDSAFLDPTDQRPNGQAERTRGVGKRNEKGRLRLALVTHLFSMNQMRCGVLRIGWKRLEEASRESTRRSPRDATRAPSQRN